MFTKRVQRENKQYVIPSPIPVVVKYIYPAAMFMLGCNDSNTVTVRKPNNGTVQSLAHIQVVQYVVFCEFTT